MSRICSPVAPAARSALALAAVLAGVPTAPVIAQQADSALAVDNAACVPRWVGSSCEAASRIRQLSGSAPLTSGMIRPLGAGASGDGGLRAEVLGAQSVTEYNSAVAFGMNDGALWAGKGLSTSMTAGAQLRWRGLTVRFAPTVTWSQNAAFPIDTLWGSQFANASSLDDPWHWRNMDRPQRFGTSAYSTFDLGQSAIKYDWRGVELGGTTENMWWGPGIDNSILMTNNAAGFPHAYLGTSHPVDIRIGTLEAMYMLGRLSDSRFWRTTAVPDTMHRWTEAVVAVFSPRGAPGLYVGGGRLFYQYVPSGGIGAGDLVRVFRPFTTVKLQDPSNPDGSEQADQLLSLFFRWAFPEVGFEVYGEWGRNDHARDTRDFLLEPEHATATLLGLQKVFVQRGGYLAVRAEATNLTNARTADIRGYPSWYAHGRVQQGYTQQGQVIGAGIGPGSDTQRLEVTLGRGWGDVGLYARRIEWDADAFYRYIASRYEAGNNLPGLPQQYHDVTTGYGITLGTQRGGIGVHANLELQKEMNRYMRRLHDVGNGHAELRLEWYPAAR